MAESQEQKTFCDFTMGDANNVCLDDAFEIDSTDVPTYTPSTAEGDKRRGPKLAPKPEPKKKAPKSTPKPQLDEETAAGIEGLTEGLGAMMGGMMGGMVKGLMNKESSVFLITKKKYDMLKEYLEAVEEGEIEISDAHKANYYKTLALIKEEIEAYDKYEDNPMMLNQVVNLKEEEIKKLPPPVYPPGLEQALLEDTAELQSKLVSEAFGGLSKDGGDCSVM